MSAPVLTLRALNRATLARQHLLRRVPLPVDELLEHLVGVQAQEPDSWYTGLWSRLDPFDPAEVSRLLESREIVRIALMRSTIHLVTTPDALALRPLLQPAVARPLSGARRAPLADPHAGQVVVAARAALAAGPLTPAELGAALDGLADGPEPSDFAMAARVHVPLVQVPPRGMWRRRGPVRLAPLDDWAGRPLGPPLSAEELVRRYLGALGPATPADAQAWSGLTRLREVFERLRPQLAVFRDEQGRELFDLPDAPRPDPETPAPPRFLPDYDNVLLGHADRTRFLSDGLRRRLLHEIGMYSYGSLLVDGRLRGLWRVERDRSRSSATLVIRLLDTLTPAEERAMTDEAGRLAAFREPEAGTRSVEIRPAT